MGRIIHGNKNFGFAPIDATGDTPVFGEPTMISGLVSASIEVEQDTSNIYADDGVYCSVKGAKVRTANVSFRYIPSAYAEYLGFKQEANGMLVDTGSFPNHCIFFETEEEDCDTGEKTTTLHYLYNVQGSEPTYESQTDEDEVEAAEIEVEYNANTSSFVVDSDGDYLQYGYITKTSANEALYEEFKERVLLPTDAISA